SGCKARPDATYTSHTEDMALLSNRSPHHASTDASRPLIFSKQQGAKETEFLFRRSARRISSGAGLQSIEELNIPTCNITVPSEWLRRKKVYFRVVTDLSALYKQQQSV